MKRITISERHVSDTAEVSKVPPLTFYKALFHLEFPSSHVATRHYAFTDATGKTNKAIIAERQKDSSERYSFTTEILILPARAKTVKGLFTSLHWIAPQVELPASYTSGEKNEQNAPLCLDVRHVHSKSGPFVRKLLRPLLLLSSRATL